ncbi:phage replisome organizer N-terminal domain-containing protein [Streptococcus uberis]
MSDVKWIKITTDIFDDEKIQLIESMPEGDSLIVIWVKLLVLAGKQNYSGVLALGNKVFYTEEMLTTVFRRKPTTIKLALKIFEEFGMIKFINGAITIPNWQKHQNIEGMEKIREQTRERVARHRDKQKRLANGEVDILLESNVTSNVTVTDGNDEVTQQIKNKKEKEKKKKNIDISSREKYPEELNSENQYIKTEYYSLLQVIADKYNDKFCFPNGYTLTHHQKMKIGEYLSERFVTSDEVLSIIERIPEDVESPLAYLFSSIERLKEERIIEQKAIAYENDRRSHS